MSLREKVEMYEKFLSKLSTYCTLSENEGIAELVKNADRWHHGFTESYTDPTEQKRYLDWSFRTLCNTPETDSKIRKRQRAFEKIKKKTNI